VTGIRLLILPHGFWCLSSLLYIEFRRLSRPGSKAGRLLPSDADIKNVWSLLHSPLGAHGVVFHVHYKGEIVRVL
jgi:hypothetical protein